jgi:hypothetical protein
MISEKLTVLGAALYGSFTALCIVPPTDAQLREVIDYWMGLCRRQLRPQHQEQEIAIWSSATLQHIFETMQGDPAPAVQRLVKQLDKLFDELVTAKNVAVAVRTLQFQGEWKPR